MIYIAHRGNMSGPTSGENNPSYIDAALDEGYHAEIDIRVIDGNLYLGHDTCQYDVDLQWLENRKDRLWIHCKNLESVEFFHGTEYNYFWHEEDTLTITSKGYLWVYPGKQPIRNSIAVMPEIYNDNITGCVGVCTDFVLKYAKNKQGE